MEINSRQTVSLRSIHRTNLQNVWRSAPANQPSPTGYPTIRVANKIVRFGSQGNSVDILAAHIGVRGEIEHCYIVGKSQEAYWSPFWMYNNTG